MIVTTIGLIAAALTTISYLPQAIKTARTKETKDISLGMYIVLVTGLFLWLVYGIFITNIPVIAANAVSFTFAGYILILKIKHG